jgi:hypothetical protein
MRKTDFVIGQVEQHIIRTAFTVLFRRLVVCYYVTCGKLKRFTKRALTINIIIYYLLKQQ